MVNWVNLVVTDGAKKHKTFSEGATVSKQWRSPRCPIKEFKIGGELFIFSSLIHKQHSDGPVITSIQTMSQPQKSQLAYKEILRIKQG